GREASPRGDRALAGGPGPHDRLRRAGRERHRYRAGREALRRAALALAGGLGEHRGRVPGIRGLLVVLLDPVDVLVVEPEALLLVELLRLRAAAVADHLEPAVVILGQGAEPD